MTVEALRERARTLIEESERIIERARQIEVETREFVESDNGQRPQRVNRKSGSVQTGSH